MLQLSAREGYLNRFIISENVKQRNFITKMQHLRIIDKLLILNILETSPHNLCCVILTFQQFDAHHAGVSSLLNLIKRYCQSHQHKACAKWPNARLIVVK